MDLSKNGAVIGYGHLGKSIARTHNIKKYFDITGSSASLDEIASCRYIFMALPTPTVNGECDTHLTRDYCKQLAQYPQAENAIIIVRSTVIPGTCRSIHESTGLTVVSHPEFLSEDTLDKDASDPMLIVLGIDQSPVRKAVWDLYKGSKCPIKIDTDTVTSETIKYALNNFFTTKVIFANMLYDICEKSGADYDTIKTVMTKHPWGSGNHWRVVDKGGRGAGGHCLVKDLKAFRTYTDSSLLKLVDQINDQLLQQSGKI